MNKSGLGNTKFGLRFGLRVLPFIVAMLLASLSVSLCSCSGDEKKVYASDIIPELTPTMTTENVSTLISDSGIVRYKVEAPVWYIFDAAKEPKWTFPKSLHLESFDDLFNKDATIDCDSATYLTNKQLWRLDGNVRVVNMAGERFLTNQLFWNQKKQVVYSDSFIQVVRADRILEGYGFVSNERMTDFTVRNVSAILPAEMMNSENGSENTVKRNTDKKNPDNIRSNARVEAKRSGADVTDYGKTPQPAIITPQTVDIANPELKPDTASHRTRKANRQRGVTRPRRFNPNH